MLPILSGFTLFLKPQILLLSEEFQPSLFKKNKRTFLALAFTEKTWSAPWNIKNRKESKQKDPNMYYLIIFKLNFGVWSQIHYFCMFGIGNNWVWGLGFFLKDKSSGIRWFRSRTLGIGLTGFYLQVWVESTVTECHYYRKTLSGKMYT